VDVLAGYSADLPDQPEAAMSSPEGKVLPAEKDVVTRNRGILYRDTNGWCPYCTKVLFLSPFSPFSRTCSSCPHVSAFRIGQWAVQRSQVSAGGKSDSVPFMALFQTFPAFRWFKYVVLRQQSRSPQPSVDKMYSSQSSEVPLLRRQLELLARLFSSAALRGALAGRNINLYSLLADILFEACSLLINRDSSLSAATARGPEVHHATPNCWKICSSRFYFPYE
jgi:hypothetical protein